MYQTLKSPEADPSVATATARLTDLYTQLIGQTTLELQQEPSQQTIDEIDLLRTGINRAHFKKGPTEGSVDKNSFRSAWGSLPGLSLSVEIQTETGPSNLFVSQKPPTGAFEILPPKSVEPIRPDYATRDIQEGFDWKDIVNYFGGERPGNPQTPLYLVVFRSQRLPEADEQLLAEYDRRAHEAAKKSESLLHYFGGKTDEQGNCLSFCLWSNMADAAAVSRDPTHQAAAKLTGQMYSSFELELYDLHKGDDEPVFVRYVDDEREKMDETKKSTSETARQEQARSQAA